MPGRFVRLGETGRRQVAIAIDGESVTALEGDTVLVAILTNSGRLRISEFGDGPRAGFCLMGACQDCWVRLESGETFRACTTPVAAGMRLLTSKSDAQWAIRA